MSTQSSPHEQTPNTDISTPQLPYAALHRNLNPKLYQFAPGSPSDTNSDIHQFNRHHVENSSSSIPSGSPPTHSLAVTDPNPTPNYPTTTTHSNYEPPPSYHYSQQGNQQDIKPLERRRSSTCAECDAPFRRPGDLQRHLETAKKHGPAKGPLCPIGGCKYLDKRFTRIDNLKVHLIRTHGVSATEAARYIQRWREKGRQ